MSAADRPAACPKFEACSAPICPLDPDWAKRSHGKGEAVCHWLRLWAKNPASLDTAGIAAGVVAEVAPNIVRTFGPLRRSLERAAKSAPKRFVAQTAAGVAA